MRKARRPDTYGERMRRLIARAKGAGLDYSALLDEVFDIREGIVILAEALGAKDPDLALALEYDLDDLLS